ncbi:hypothetical protein HCUR_00908 [Holospora curviuscula]|uniref:Uncharacterized protein n=1 Tax=Holospora curviuscula TaxID=1082868 RepID=A0A2S5R8N5_9PROT|nr:hypothetical protein HCUR_00908 [Holospora curviuscula]
MCIYFSEKNILYGMFVKRNNDIKEKQRPSNSRALIYRFRVEIQATYDTGIYKS